MPKSNLEAISEFVVLIVHYELTSIPEDEAKVAVGVYLNTSW